LISFAGCEASWSSSLSACHRDVDGVINYEQGYIAAAAQDAQGRIDRFFDRTLRANISNS
jgi:dienelactone hydrolase